MQFAYDQHRKLIVASSARPFTVYFCPACDKQVTARSLGPGRMRAPYFAHLRGVTNAECENYNPSFWVSSNVRRSSASRYQPTLPYTRGPRLLSGLPSGAGIRYVSNKNLYLKFEDKWNLYFSISFKKSTNYWSGRLLINGIFGQTEINYHNADKKFSAIVPFNFSENTVEKEGYVDEFILLELEKEFPSLELFDYSFFLANETSGRLLSQGESLRLGQEYSLVTKFIIPGEIYDLANLSFLAEVDSYSIYQLCISAQTKIEDIHSLEEFFEKKVESQKPQIALDFPLPHGIEVDGTVLIPQSSKNLRLDIQPSLDDIDIRALGGVIDESNTLFQDNTVEIELEKIEGILIYWQNSLLLAIEKHSNHMHQFHAALIETADGNTIDMLDSASLAAINFGDLISVTIPAYYSKKKIRYQSFEGSKALPDLLTISDSDVIDVRPFGYASFFKQVPLESDPPVDRYFVSERATRLAKLILSQSSIADGFTIQLDSHIAKIFPGLSGRKVSKRYLPHLRLLEKIVLNRSNHDN